MDDKRKKSKSKSKSNARKKFKIKHKNKQPQKPALDFIKSKNILKGILLYVSFDTRFEIIKYNKSIMEKCGYSKESKETIKELMNRASLNELLSENYIVPFLVNKDDNRIKEDYYEVLIYKALKEKQIKLNYVNFFSYLENIDFKIFKLEKYYSFSKEYLKDHDAEFYKKYHENNSKLVEKYFECLDVLFKSLIVKENCDFSLTFDYIIQKGNLAYKEKIFDIEKYGEFLEKHHQTIKNINIIGAIFGFPQIYQQNNEQNKKIDPLEIFLNKTKDLKRINVKNSYTYGFKILLSHGTFKNLEILSVEIGDYFYDKLDELFAFITNNSSIKILVIKSIRLFLELINKYKINNKIKIILLINVLNLPQFEQIGKNLTNDLFLYVFSENSAFNIIDSSFKMFKILKFHCKGKLQIKYENFSLDSTKEINKTREITNDYLQKHNVKYNFEDETEKKIEKIINCFENELINKNNYTYEFDDLNKNNTKLILPFNSKKDEFKESIKNLNYQFSSKNPMSKNLVNLKKINIQITNHYDIFFTRCNIIMKYLTNIEECTISFIRTYYSRNYNLNIKTEKGKYARNILKECENLKYLYISKFWFDLEDDENYIKKIVNKKKKNKFSIKLKYIILKLNINEEANVLLNIKKEVKRINEECYQNMINGYPKILFFVFDSSRINDDGNIFFNDINELVS